MFWFLQKYAEETLSAKDPTQPPPPPLQHYLEQPVERVQKYQALLKVTCSSLIRAGCTCWGRGGFLGSEHSGSMTLGPYLRS
jgi:hypothetical protein